MPISMPFKRKSYKPSGRRLLGISDGDTPKIELPIRMANIDTPEKAGYAGLPDKAQPKLDTAMARLRSGAFGIDVPALTDYFADRIHPQAAAYHIAGGNAATAALQRLHDTRLLRDDLSFRRLGVFPQGDAIDFYGRLLAYTAPWYTPAELAAGPDRSTFNLNLIEEGWAAFFPFYPSLPRDADFNLALDAATAAWDAQRGVWAAFGGTFLLAYEYRMLIKLGQDAQAVPAVWDKTFYRHCIDLRDMTDAGRYGFCDVPPPYRLWVAVEDLAQARIDIGFA